MEKSIKDWTEVINSAKKSIKDTEPVVALCDKFSKEPLKSVSERVMDIIDDANYSAEVLKDKGCHTTTAIAKDLGMKSAKQLSSELFYLGILMRSGSEWQLKAAFSDKGLAKTRTSKNNGQTWRYLVWTEKGRRWLHALKERGFLQTTPMPKIKEVKVEEQPQSTVIAHLPAKPTLLQLIEYIQQDFECLIALAKDCIANEGSAENRKALESDIRSINTDTSIVMRKLEEACYQSLAI